MIVNSHALLNAAPIKCMAIQKETGPGGTSYGLSEAGYDIRIKQQIHFCKKGGSEQRFVLVTDVDHKNERVGATELKTTGRFTLASAMEEFQMPDNLVGIVHDKSTWARRGLSVFNTVIESGWNGFLTLELIYHGEGELVIPAGAGIAQVIFHENAVRTRYTGKYDNQPDRPVGPIDSV